MKNLSGKYLDIACLILLLLIKLGRSHPSKFRTHSWLCSQGITPRVAQRTRYIVGKTYHWTLSPAPWRDNCYLRLQSKLIETFESHYLSLFNLTLLDNLAKRIYWLLTCDQDNWEQVLISMSLHHWTIDRLGCLQEELWGNREKLKIFTGEFG